MSDKEMWVCDKCGKEIWKVRQQCIEAHNESAHWSDTESHIEKYKRVREQIPERYVSAYDEISGGGTAIKSIQAAIEYIETSKSQYDVADEYDTNDVTVRKAVDELISYGVVSVEEVKNSSLRTGKGAFGNYTGGKGRWEKSA